MVDLFSPKEILTVEELSERLKIQISTIRNKVFKGDIPYFKLGPGKRAPVRFLGIQINEWLSKNQGGTDNKSESVLDHEKKKIKRSPPKVREGFEDFLDNVEKEQRNK